MDNPVSRIPFDPYDFFGYLASGLVVIAGMDLVLGFPNILRRDFKIIDGILLLIAVYVMGQIVASLAKAVIEDGLVGRMLRRPGVNLFETKKPRIRGFFFPGYYKPFPEQTRQIILSKAESEGVKGADEDLFLHVRYSPVVLQDQKLMDKLNSFINKYGFNRNLGFAAFIVGIALLIKAKFFASSDPEQLKYGITALVVAIFLLYRYLKFFRQYSYEMFNAYGRAK